jgi:hypothetical protein
MYGPGGDLVQSAAAAFSSPFDCHVANLLAGATLVAAPERRIHLHDLKHADTAVVSGIPAF